MDQVMGGVNAVTGAATSFLWFVLYTILALVGLGVVVRVCQAKGIV